MKSRTRYNYTIEKTSDIHEKNLREWSNMDLEDRDPPANTIEILTFLCYLIPAIILILIFLSCLFHRCLECILTKIAGTEDASIDFV
ncbi:unnamed protein product [Larinioides sclopetarius]|uniref:Uncharacterized protein n=1 Tax=Larinioides sclopetarius TaxID=280406 RepID=A0AAV2AJI8_9ARAC